MKIKSVKSWKENFGLIRPYTIASKGTTYDVSNILVEVSLENGIKGLGASAPTEIDEGYLENLEEERSDVVKMSEQKKAK